MLNRRGLMRTTGALAASAALGKLCNSQTGNEEKSLEGSADPWVVDTNVSLFRWPFRRLPLDETTQLVSRLKALQVVEAWAGGLDAILHRDLSAANARLTQECSQHAVLRPVGAINWSLPDWQEDMRRCVKARMHAIRIYPGMHGYRLEQAKALFQMAQAAKLVLQIVVTMEDARTQHPLTQVPETDLRALPALAAEHRDLPIQLLNHRLRTAQVETLSQRQNVYFDTSRVESVDGVPRLVEQVSADRVLYGSHAPLLTPEAAMIRVHESGRLAASSLAAVYGRSAAGVRKPPPAAKRQATTAVSYSQLGLPSAEELREYRIWDSYFTPSHSHPGKEGDRLEADVRRALPSANKAHFEKLCFFAHVGIGTTTDAALERRLRERPDQIEAPLRKWPNRLLGMIQLNANDVSASLAAVERWIARGPMVGVYFPGSGPGALTCTHENFVPLVERISQLHGVIMQHTWFKTGGKDGPGESTPAELAELAAKFPKQPFLCAHAGGEWQRGIRAIRKHKNVLVETSGFDATAGFIEMAVRELGPERIVFGSHLPSRSLGTELAKVIGANIGQRAKKMILGENYRGLLRPILEAKS